MLLSAGRVWWTLLAPTGGPASGSQWRWSAPSPLDQMPDYRLFGSTLRSQLHLPELRTSGGTPVRWALTTTNTLPSVSNPVVMGQEEVEPGVGVKLTRHDSGLRLTFDDTGTFDISPDGSTISWCPPSLPDMDAARKDVLGRVLSVCLHLQGSMVLHGSAVDLDGHAVAFLAPKFHGKSTTAAALVDSGARLLADDLVVVSSEKPPTVLPSLPYVQLWQDSAKHVAPDTVAVEGSEASKKAQRRWDLPGRVADSAVTLAAIYLLAPIPPTELATVARRQLSAVEGTLAMLGQAKVGVLLGVEQRAALVRQLGDLAEQIPVFRLALPRDFERLGEVTDALWRWHGTAGRACPPSS